MPEHAVTGHAAQGLTQNAPVLFHIGPLPVSNSMLVAWIVTLLMIFLVRAAAGKIAMVPTGLQNFFEFLIEGLYDMLGAILGAHLVRKTFWFFASLFLFILFANWLSLVPLVGNLTVETADHGRVGLLRAANSDLNMTLALASIYGILWLYWSLTEIGVGGSIKHIFGAPAGSEGVMKVLLPIIFFCVGIIEVISILFRQVSLPLRLYGNIFAGETLLETMTHIGISIPGLGALLGWFLPLPFYFLEVLVALVQALVFMLLTSVFTTLMCQHEEEHHEEAAH